MPSLGSAIGGAPPTVEVRIGLREAMTPPAPTPEERATAHDIVTAWKYATFPGAGLEPPDGDLIHRIAKALATAHARGRAEALEAAAQRVEASRFRPHEEEPNIVDSALNAAAAAIRALGGG